MNWDTLLLIVVPMVGYLVAYRLYGRYLARKIFHLSDERPVPSRQLEDGRDYVPTRRGIIFGHHYTSIAGTGPIVGPAIGIIWGWLPALIWVVVGSIFMGAVHDFGALVISLRNQGKSLSEVANKYVNRRVRTIFFLIVFFELWIVIAIFALIIGVLFSLYPQSVFPIWMEIPIAVILGLAIYRWKRNVLLSTLVAVTVMYVTVVAGHWLPFALPKSLFGLPPSGAWAMILLAYAFIASTLAVRTLLQPRDYINGWQLYVAMGLLLLGAIVSAAKGDLRLVAPAYNTAQTGAPPLMPFLFVTIACGAISGFHCLVASGTTAKQVSRESDALSVGYGSMLLEGMLAVLIIIAVAAGIGMNFPAPLAGEVSPAWSAYYSKWLGDAPLGSKLKAVVEGSANMLESIYIDPRIGVVIIGVFIASFAGTTLDTATRIQRYVLAELGADFRINPLTNKYVATSVAVLAAVILAFATGGGAGAMTLWPMFGAVNQLLAALALLLLTIYLKKRTRRGWLVAAVPCVIMLVVTNYAMALNEKKFIGKRAQAVSTLAVLEQKLCNASAGSASSEVSGDPEREMLLKDISKQAALRRQFTLLSVINLLTQALAVWMTIEAAIAFFRTRQDPAHHPVLETAR